MEGILLPLIIGSICGVFVVLVYTFWKKIRNKK